LGRVELLRGDHLGGGEGPVALVVGFGLAGGGLGRRDVRVGRGGFGASGLQLGHGLAGAMPAAHQRLGVPQVRLGLLETGDEIAPIEHDERVARLHVLVLLDRHPVDEPRDPGRDRGDVAVDLGVVAAHMVPAVEPAAHAPAREGDHQDDPDDHGQAAGPAPGLGLGRGGDVHRDVGRHTRSRRAGARVSAFGR
jgi:hypothetical protein